MEDYFRISLGKYWRFTLHHTNEKSEVLIPVVGEKDIRENTRDKRLDDAWQAVVSQGPGTTAVKVKALLENIDHDLISRLHDQQINRNIFKLFGKNAEKIDGRLSYNHLAAGAIFFQGLYQYLESSNQTLYSHAALFAAWQWFNMQKTLYLVADRTAAKKNILEVLQQDLALAYRAVFSLLNDAEYTAALNWLATEADWENGNNLDSTLRERALRSLFLTSPDMEERAVNQLEFRPLPAPGLCKTEICWDDLSLHPVFRLKKSLREVERFVHSFCLPHYDFSSALHLVALVRAADSETKTPNRFQTLWREFKRKTRQVLSHPVRLLVGSVLWLILSILISHLFVVCRGDGMNTRPVTLFCINTFQFFFFTTGLCMLICLLGLKLSMYFSLPRLVCGVVVGYLALLLQSDPALLSGVFWQGGRWLAGIRIFLLWLAVLLFGCLYLKHDILPILQNDRLACRRSLFILCMAVYISALLGLFGIAVTTSMQRFSIDSYFILGIFGWVDLSQYLIYVPLALLTGLVTQLIFEDEPLTAPVWSPEQPN